MPRKPNVPVIDEEVTFSDEGLDARGLITRTDLKGIITYASKAYRQMTKYPKDELVGEPHSIVRHPDMPSAAFKQMWDDIQNNQTWEGYVKNLRKDGRYYWVIVHIEPIFDEDGKKIGYVGLRREPERAIIKNIEKKYKEMLADEKK
jgi:aerotaxis receptor